MQILVVLPQLAFRSLPPLIPVLVRMSIEVVVRIRPDEVDSAEAGVSPRIRPPREVLEAVAEFGVALDPAQPGESAESPSGWFVAYVADPDLARDVVNRLSGCESVDAAYVKPPAEAP